VANSDEQLLSVLATLEECRAALRQARKDDTAQLLSVAILDLRMKLSHIADAELKALCEEMLSETQAREGRRRPLLRLVK
jgi:predicted negative regulator of RcsB-dependent stress response